MPTGVAVSRGGRIFVCFPKWGDQVEYTVAEVVDGRTVPYPDAATNQPQSNHDPHAFVSVQSVVVDARDRLWILDTGSPMFKPTEEGGPKLVCVDLSTNQVAMTIVIPSHVALPTSYLNDVRFDLRRGKAGAAFITDSSDQGADGLIVIDLESYSCWRRLHNHPSTKAEPILPVVEGQPLSEHEPGRSPKPVKLGADGISISPDGSRLFYCPLVSRKLYSVGVDALLDSSKSDKQVGDTVTDEGDKGGIADGLQTDAEGRVYMTSPEHNAILRRTADGFYESVAHDPRLLWPDTMHLAEDGYLYVTANQLNRQARYHEGRDLRRKPYALFRTRVDARPVLLG
jgi:sugar lactone lactonase YvrE